ncbi:MAG: hypothetical protein M9916_04885 [Crocinitomicaceae bacterium]|nr:hypothetical protein [Crocinitomicaceae bacterium]
MKKISLYVACFALTLGFTSCKKEGCTDPTAENYSVGATKDDGSCTYPQPAQITPPTYNPVFAGTFGTLVAIKTVATTSTPLGDVDTNIGTAVAAFSENGGSTFLPAGTVKCNSTALNVMENHTYNYTVTADNPQGISFGSTINWEGDGSTWPAFTASTSQVFSTVGTITSGNPSTSSNYTLSVNSASGADSTLFMLVGTNGYVMKVVAGSPTQHTFTAAEVSSCGAGTGILEVVGLNYDPQTIATRAYYLINETARVKTVTIE